MAIAVLAARRRRWFARERGVAMMGVALRDVV